MPISKHELDTLVTKGDLVELRDNFRALLAQMQATIINDLKTLLVSQKGTPRLVTPAQFAQCLAELPQGRRVSADTIRRWCKEGSLKATQEGGSNTMWLIPLEELDRIHANACMIEPVRPR